jgi:hypothetical protein
MRDFAQHGDSRRLSVILAGVPRILRTYHPLVKLIVVGLLAISVSGVLCGLIAWGFGRDAVAGDTLSAKMTVARCKQLIENNGGPIVDYFMPGTTEIENEGSCRQGELVDHSEEVVSLRLAAIVMAGIVSLGYLLACQVWLRHARESASVRKLEYLLGFGAFGLAAAALLATAAFRGLVDGDTAGLGRWLSDGSVAAVFCCIYALLALSDRRSAKASTKTSTA